MTSRAVGERIVVSDQPSPEEIDRLPAEGFTAVVNLRQDGEPEQPLDTAAEGDRVRELGLDYLSLPVGGRPLTTEMVDAVCGFIDHAPGKVLVHCRRGPRAVALVLLHQARANAWPAEEVLARGDAMGLRLDGNLRMMVAQYLSDN